MSQRLLHSIAVFICLGLPIVHFSSVQAQSDEELKRQATVALGLMQFVKPGTAQLARAGSIQRDLKLTLDQMQQIQGIEMKAKSATKQKMSEQKKKNPLRTMRETKEESDRILQTILTPEQYQRLRQIMLQLEIRNQGLTMIVTLEKLEDKLAFTDDQRAKMQEERQAFDKAVVKGMREHGKNGIRQHMDAYQVQSRQRILALMNSMQRKQFDDLVGNPFDFSNANDLPQRK